eukprot:scaffold3118_cov264-Pinguiococcus_pyrenoidosus.AAC.6
MHSDTHARGGPGPPKRSASAPADRTVTQRTGASPSALYEAPGNLRNGQLLSLASDQAGSRESHEGEGKVQEMLRSVPPEDEALSARSGEEGHKGEFLRLSQTAPATAFADVVKQFGPPGRSTLLRDNLRSPSLQKGPSARRPRSVSESEADARKSEDEKSDEPIKRRTPASSSPLHSSTPKQAEQHRPEAEDEEAPEAAPDGAAATATDEDVAERVISWEPSDVESDEDQDEAPHRAEKPTGAFPPQDLEATPADAASSARPSIAQSTPAEKEEDDESVEGSPLQEPPEPFRVTSRPAQSGKQGDLSDSFDSDGSDDQEVEYTERSKDFRKRLADRQALRSKHDGQASVESKSQSSLDSPVSSDGAKRTRASQDKGGGDAKILGLSDEEGDEGVAAGKRGLGEFDDY